MERGAWWAIVNKVTKSQTLLKQLSMHAHTHTTYYLYSSVDVLLLNTWVASTFGYYEYSCYDQG